nr:MAG TPA: hypothetical protein [Caudoviricetes sp.]
MWDTGLLTFSRVIFCYIKLSLLLYLKLTKLVILSLLI